MALFLTDQERALIEAQRHQAPLNRFYWALIKRAQQRAASPGLTKQSTTTEWWHHAAEYVTDGAIAYALHSTDALAQWVRDVTLSIVRRPEADWVGPWFRNHEIAPPIGHLETAHLCLAVAVALDLAPDVFSPTEFDEAASVLRERGIPLCVRWLNFAKTLNNWRSILTFGLAVSAAVLDEREIMAYAADAFALNIQGYQPDGSYGESLQYSNYAAYGMMLTYEALVRRDPAYAEQLSFEPYAHSMRWVASSYFYSKPLPGWGPYPQPRVANFNDCGAIHRPSADVLLHIASRAGETLPVEAGLARWLFDTLYTSLPANDASDRATFGLLSDFGFLTLPLLPQAVAPLSPQTAKLPTVASFSNGDVLARQEWDTPTILAVHGGGDALHAPSHLHGDLNSFILVHNRERLLLDPGHSCYRNLLRTLDIGTRAHNTCTFTRAASIRDLRQEDQFSVRTWEQSATGRRQIVDGGLGAPFDRGGRRLLAAQIGDVIAIGSEAAKLYGLPVERFARFWLLCGEHALFIIDHIVSTSPVRTTWHWLFNNRDGRLDFNVIKPNQIVAWRGDAGIKLFHLGSGVVGGPTYAYVHDAYHPLPNQRGEGKPGSGLLMHWQEPEAATERVVVHAIAVDSYGAIADWQLRQEQGQIMLDGLGGNPQWRLDVAENPLSFAVRNATGDSYRIDQDEISENWALKTT